jgi:aspartate aminotransferase
VEVEAKPENNFMPTAEDLKPHLKDAVFIALCSPQNPTGTTFKKEELEKICALVVEENKRRTDDQKKLYVMYDQMYWHLTYGDTKHYDPVSLNPEMREYTVYIDAISKVFASTGVRVGWSLGPKLILDKMKAILSHVGAWAPMAEQKAVAKFLYQTEAVDSFLAHFKQELEERLRRIYEGFIKLKKQGHNIDAVAPEAGIYLTIKFDLVGKKTEDGTILQTQADVTSYLLQYASLAVVPFYAFGASQNSSWYRLSVGTCKKEEIDEMLGKLSDALGKLS